MSEPSRFMLVVSPLMKNSPAFDRAAALAKASGAALHIVAFDYLEGLVTAGLVNEQAREEIRLGYVERHQQWLEEQARPLRKIGVHVTTEVVWVNNPLQEILIHLEEAKMAVLIKELEHESLLSRLMFTPRYSSATRVPGASAFCQPDASRTAAQDRCRRRPFPS